MSNPNQVRLLRVSNFVLAEALGLPATVQIVNASVSRETHGEIVLAITCDNFSPVAEGARIPPVQAEFSTSPDGTKRFRGWR